MKKLLTLPLFFFLIVVVILFWWVTMSSPVNSRDTQTRDFIVSKGQTGSQIANNLQKYGFIKSSLAFRIYTKLTGSGNTIQAGDYQLSPNLSIGQIAQVFEKGPLQLWVTIPEGLRREEIAERAIKTLNLEGDTATKFTKDFLTTTQGKEGMLFPDTYLLGKDDTGEIFAQKMIDHFNQKITQQMFLDAKKNNLTLPQVLTIASIIERETRTDEERPIVAGILFNRLESQHALQVDATLQYASANRRCYDPKGSMKFECNWWQAPTGDDTDIKSLYNTYTHVGLPPSPISNPGLSAINAAIYPQQTDYFFYLHERNGQIHYAKTGSEHEANVIKYLR